MIDIVLSLTCASVASCDCDTKTHETQFHNETCRYRIMSEAADEIERLRECCRKARNSLQDGLIGYTDNHLVEAIGDWNSADITSVSDGVEKS